MVLDGFGSAVAVSMLLFRDFFIDLKNFIKLKGFLRLFGSVTEPVKFRFQYVPPVRLVYRS
jgi:hypothetical protein